MKMSIVTTNDRRVLSGFLSDEDTNSIVLRGFDGADITIPRKNIISLKPAGRSLMPSGLLNGLDDAALRNFSHIFEFLNRLLSNGIRPKSFLGNRLFGEQYN